MESVGGKAEKNIYLGKQSEKRMQSDMKKKKGQSVRKEEGKVYKWYKQF